MLILSGHLLCKRMDHAKELHSDALKGLTAVKDDLSSIIVCYIHIAIAVCMCTVTVYIIYIWIYITISQYLHNMLV